jgi:HAD superfamily hydrolase (TIGR01509 family)
MSALLLGSISTIADTSEMQRQAFNEAFEAHGLDWHWDRDDYLAMLEKSGGRDRVAEYARSTGQDVDADAVHATKSEIFRKNVATSPPPPRPGVVDAVKGARGDGLKVALVTTTSPDNVASLIDALGPDLGRDDFDLIVDSSSVGTPKPDAAACAFALESLGESADACVAVEDNVGGVEAAVAAGVSCVAFPNANTAGHDFGRATTRTDRLDLAELEGFTSRG